MKDRSISETIGLLAVLAGLVFVGLEIRQNNRFAQAAAYQEIGFTTAANWTTVSSDPEFNRIYLRHFFADSIWWREQSPEVVERLASHWIGDLRQLETIYLQVELGLLDEVALERLGWGAVRGLPAVKHLWPIIGIAVEPGFSAYLTADWPEVPEVTGPAGLPPLS